MATLKELGFWCIAVYRDWCKSPIKGYVIADSSSTKKIMYNKKEVEVAATRGLSANACANMMASGLKIENLSYENGQIKFTSGTEEDYAACSINIDKTISYIGTGTKNRKMCCDSKGKYIYPIIVIGKDPNVGGVVCISSETGLYSVYKEQQLIEGVERGMAYLSNATVVNDNGSKYIRSKRGELPVVDLVNERPATATKEEKPKVTNTAPAQPVNTNVEAPKTPVTNNTATSSPSVGNISYDDVFEFGFNKDFGTYIKRVKAKNKEQLDRLFGIDVPIRPFNYNGKIVNNIDVLAFSQIVPDFDGVYVGEKYSEWYCGGLSVNAEQYGRQGVNRFIYDGRGKSGFRCVDFSEIFYTDIEDKQLRIVRVNLPLRFYGTIIVPHYTIEGKIPVAMRGTIGSGNSQLCLLENISNVAPKVAAHVRGVDFSRSAVTFIADNFAVENKDLNWVKLNNRIEKIHAHAFRECSHLRDFELTPSVKEIGEFAFALSALNEIKFAPGTAVTRIGAKAYASSSLKSLDLSFVEGTISTSVFEHTYIKGEVTIPGSVVKVGSKCFAHTDVTKLIISEGVEEIGSKLNTAEVGTDKIKHFEIVTSKTLKSIGDFHDSDDIAYVITLGHGYAVEKCAISLKSTTKNAGVKLNYIDEAIDNERSAFIVMIEAMGEDAVIDSFMRKEGGNDTPFTLEELLKM